MVKGIILQLGTVLLLVQLLVAGASSEKEEALNRLHIFTVEEFSKVAIFVVETNKKLFEAVIREGSASKNKQLQTHLSKLSEFVEKANKWKETSSDTDKLVNLVMDIADLHAQFDYIEVKKPSQDISIINDLLKKHDSQKVMLEASKRFLTFIDDVIRRRNEYMPSEQEERDWFQSHISEGNMVQKFQESVVRILCNSLESQIC